jgi:hypothetical protein
MANTLSKMNELYIRGVIDSLDRDKEVETMQRWKKEKFTRIQVLINPYDVVDDIHAGEMNVHITKGVTFRCWYEGSGMISMSKEKIEEYQAYWLEVEKETTTSITLADVGDIATSMPCSTGTTTAFIDGSGDSPTAVAVQRGIEDIKAGRVTAREIVNSKEVQEALDYQDSTSEPTDLEWEDD